MQAFKSCGPVRPWAPTARSLVALCACLLFAGRATAQDTGRISGKVTAKENGEPLRGATVQVQGTTRSSVTDANGAYSIINVSVGPAVIMARFLGREPQQISVTVPADGAAEGNFALKAAALRLSDVVVSASREVEKRVAVPAAIGVVDGGTLRATDPNHPSEVMNRIAGVYVPITNGEGHMTSIRQPITTDPVYLYLEDGIPTRSTGFFNHNALYEVNLPQADRIEVVKGPATALYGSDAIGGVINVSTRAPALRPQAGISLVGGAYNWGRLLATGSNTWGGTGVRADLNLTRTDGWRDSTSYDRQSGTVRWDQRLGATSRLKTVATYSRIDQQSEASPLSLSDYLTDPAINYSPFAVRQVKAARASVAYEQEGGSHSLTVTPYARYDRMRLIPNWTITYDPSDYTTQNKSLGAEIKYGKDFAPLRMRLIVGADVDYSPGGQVETQMADTLRDGIYTPSYPGTTLYDYDVTYHGVSQYLQAEVTPVERLRLDAGVRVDESGYDYTNNLTPLATGRWRRPADTTVSYRHVSPKAGATYQFAEALNLFAAYRHGFRAPSQSQLFRQGSAVNTVGLQPVKVNSYEVGVRGRIARRVDYDVSAYSMIKTDDILNYTSPNGHSEAQNAGKTTHRGIETSLGIAIVPALRFDLAYSYSKHFYADWSTVSTGTILSGKEMVQAPREMGTASLTFAPARWNGARLGIDVERLGGYWEDQANTHKYAGYTLYNLRAGSPPLRGFVVSVRLMNLTNELYSTLSAYTASQGEQFTPGMGRRLYITTGYNFP
jgi:iron complex outermembrane recepter protein